MRFRFAWIIVLGGLFVSGQALAYNNFLFNCGPNNYVSKPAGVDHVFQIPLNAVPPGSDQVEIIFEPHIPGSWFAQWCQVSTGICYFANQTITLPAGQSERIDLDFFVQGDMTPQVGWVNLTIRSVADPLEVAHCTYTLFSGMPEPNPPKLSVDCTDNVRQLASGDYAEFFTPFRNYSNQPDTLLLAMTTAMPGDWFAQFCQVSTGTCFFDYGTMPIAANATDSIHVQIWMGAVPSSGAIDFLLQSKRNPSTGTECYYRVYVGQGSADAPEVSASTSVRVVPNPSSAATSIFLRADRPGTGAFGIYAADGRLVREFPGLQLDGNLVLRWDGLDRDASPVPRGVYFYRFVAGEERSNGLIIRR